MALKIRMRQQGRKNRQTFRLVVTDTRHPRDGKYVEMLGAYDPHRKEGNFTINTERLSYWLGQGAQFSERAERLVKGIAPEVVRGVYEKKEAGRLKELAKKREKKKTVAAKAPSLAKNQAEAEVKTPRKKAPAAPVPAPVPMGSAAKNVKDES